jgi:3-deoxy-D-manno-octulosonic-acid transferase
VETELWPGLLRAAAAEAIPVLVANARLSDRSLARTLRFRGAFGSALTNLSAAAQSEEHGRRFGALGVPPERVRVTGNMKYDLEPPAAFAAQREALEALAGLTAGGGPLWTAGSVREGEEAPVLEAHAALRQKVPGLRLLLAPRHLDRAARCVEEARGLGLAVARRSSAGPAEAWDVLVLDTLGELWAAYAVADLAFVGGSLVPAGGQNVLEPAFLGVPALFGPSMENFSEEARRLTLAGAAVQVESSRELVERMEQLMGDPAARAEMGRLAQGVVESYKGAMERTAALIREAAGGKVE